MRSPAGCSDGGAAGRSIRPAEDGGSVEIIDQTQLPFRLVVRRLRTVADAAAAIRDMQVRGAPLIGATAAFGMAFAMRDDPSDANLAAAAKSLSATRPTGVNLRWAVDGMRASLQPLPPDDRAAAAWKRAAEICEEDAEICSAIGDHGLPLIRGAWEAEGRRVNVLTHCNAGRLATVEWGTALAPVYKAHEAGIPVHVWVDETRPRNQGGRLTAWELARRGVPHTVVVDNAGGHLMQNGMVDLCVTGADRVTAAGDVCNKIGTYLKALAARDNGVPFHVAVPGPTIDWTMNDGVTDMPIEQRGAEEVSTMTGLTADGRVATVEIVPEDSPVANHAFDVTPARLVTGLISERGICAASKEGLRGLYPEMFAEPARPVGDAS